MGEVVLTGVLALIVHGRLKEPHRLLIGAGYCEGVTTFSAMVAGFGTVSAPLFMTSGPAHREIVRSSRAQTDILALHPISCYILLKGQQ